MSEVPAIEVSYFPGCSLATTAKESNQSLIECCRKMGIRMVELADWNCCGSSSARSIHRQTAFDLAWSLQPLGIQVPAERGAGGRSQVDYPIRAVHFSNLIVQ